MVIALEPPPDSRRSYVALAIGRSALQALGCAEAQLGVEEHASSGLPAEERHAGINYTRSMEGTCR